MRGAPADPRWLSSAAWWPSVCSGRSVYRVMRLHPFRLLSRSVPLRGNIVTYTTYGPVFGATCRPTLDHRRPPDPRINCLVARVFSGQGRRGRVSGRSAASGTANRGTIRSALEAWIRQSSGPRYGEERAVASARCGGRAGSRVAVDLHQVGRAGYPGCQGIGCCARSGSRRPSRPRSPCSATLRGSPRPGWRRRRADWQYQQTSA